MTDLTRLVPLLISAGFASTQAEEIQGLVDTSLDMTRVVSAKAELTHIRNQLLFALASDQLPNDIERNFAAFIKKNLHSDARDPSLDPWDEPYRLRIHDDEYELYSVGPDGQRDTDDDIWMVLPRR